jgi:hypothetical protein
MSKDHAWTRHALTSGLCALPADYDDISSVIVHVASIVAKLLSNLMWCGAGWSCVGMRARKKPVGTHCLLGFCSSHLSYEVVNDTIDFLEQRKRTLRLRHVKLSRIKSVMSRSQPSYGYRCTHHPVLDRIVCYWPHQSLSSVDNARL